MRSGLTSSTRQQQTLNFTIDPVGASATPLSLALYYTGNISVTWNPGIVSTIYSSNTNISRSFAQSYTSTGATGTIRGNVNLIRKISIGSDISMTVPSSETLKLHTLADFSASNGATATRFQSWQFDMSSLPPAMTSFVNGGLNTSFGSIGSSASTNLPAGLTTFSVGGKNTITGDISHLPSTLTSFAITNTSGQPSTFNLTGNIDSLPLNISSFGLRGSYSTISGNLSSLSLLSSLTSFSLYGLNTVTGDIASIPTNVQTFDVRGNNTIYGDIANIPASVTYFYLSGNNYVSGDISTLKPTLQTLYLTSGTNTITGDLSTLNCPLMGVFSVYGRNRITGDIADLPATVNNFNMYGYNTINGNTANIKPAMRYFFWRSLGTMSGNINSIPNGMQQFSVTPLTVNIYPGPSFGINTVSGNLADIPNTVFYFALSQLTGTLTYTGKTWPVMDYFLIAPKTSPYGLSQTIVNQLLIDFAAATWSGSYKYINLAGFNAAPNYSDPTVAAAIATLQTKVTQLLLTP